MLSEPIGWQRKKVKEIGDVVGGGTPDRGNLAYWNGSIPWATPTDITALKTKFITRTKECISEEGLSKSSAKLHPEGTVLMTSRATIAYPAIAAVPIATNQGFQSIRCKDDVSNEFIYYSLIANRSRLEKLSSGSTFAELSSSVFKEFELALPPFSEQKGISSILSKVDACIESNELLLNKLTDLKKALMQELFTKGVGHREFKDSPLGRIPKEWEIKKLFELLHSIFDCEHKTAPTVENGMFRIAGTTDIRNGELIYQTMRRTDKKHYDEWTSRAVPTHGDIIFTREAPAGEAALVPPNAKVCLGQRTVLLRPDKTKILPGFLLHSLYSPLVRKSMESDFIGTTVTRINMADIKMLKCIMPPLHEQKIIDDVLTSTTERISFLRNKIDSFYRLKQALMQDLLSGKVRVKAS